MKQLKKEHRALIGVVAIVVLLLVSILGCSTQSTTSAPASTTPASTGGAVLTIVNGSQTVTYTMSALKALPVTGQMSSTGVITGPNQYKGVAMTELLKAVGGITDTSAVRVSAKDGYAMTLSYNQVTQGSGFPVLDSTTGKEVTATNKPIVFVAYEMDGKALDDTIGPLRLGIMTSNTQVTDGHWWVKWAQKIEVVSTVQPWTLKLDGAITENIDQATFESGAAIGCHGVKYTDADGHAWEGIPLWYLIGRVDDPTDTHKGDAFSDEIAAKGYEVQLIAADGYTVKLASANTTRNNGMIVAYKMDGKPLADKNWPLKLVGSAVTKQQGIGGIVSMKLVFPTAATTVMAGPVILNVIKGSQNNGYSLSGIKALPALTGFAGQKSKTGNITGPLPYKGVALTDLLATAGGITEANSVKITASDNYTKTLTYSQITKGDFTTYDSTGNAANAEMKPVVFLAYEQDGKALDAGTGPLQLGVMTCKNQVTDGSWWVKIIVKIEITTP